MSEPITYFDKDEFWTALTEWRAHLDDNRGERAVLRRAKSPEDVYLTRAFHDGFVRFMAAKGFPLKEEVLERLAGGVGLLAHADPRPGEHFAAQLAHADKGSQQVRDVRFHRLMDLEYGDELYLMLLRMIRLLGGTVDARSLFRSVYHWNEKVRKDWARRYYSAA